MRWIAAAVMALSIASCPSVHAQTHPFTGVWEVTTQLGSEKPRVDGYVSFSCASWANGLYQPDGRNLGAVWIHRVEGQEAIIHTQVYLRDHTFGAFRISMAPDGRTASGVATTGLPSGPYRSVWTRKVPQNLKLVRTERLTDNSVRLHLKADRLFYFRRGDGACIGVSVKGETRMRIAAKQLDHARHSMTVDIAVEPNTPAGARVLWVDGAEVPWNWRSNLPAGAQPAPDRSPRIVSVTPLARDDADLGPHPAKPAFLLAVHGYNLRGSSGSVVVESAGADTTYEVLAEADFGQPYRLPPGVALRLQRLPEYEQAREQRRIGAAWQHALRVATPAGAVPEGGGRHVVLVRADLNRNREGTQRLVIGKAAKAWSVPVPAAPRRTCPELLRTYVQSDFDYQRWIAWDDIWGHGPVRVEHMLPDSLLHREETRASRLEALMFSLPELLGERHATKAVAFDCQFTAPTPGKLAELQLALVGEYYFARRRLRDGVLLTLHHLVGLTRLSAMSCSAGPTLGRFSFEAPGAPASAIRGVACPDYKALPGAVEACQRMKQECRSNDHFGAVVDQADAAYRQWQLIDSHLRPLLAREEWLVSMAARTRARPEEWPEFKALREKIQPMQAAKRLLEQSDPWIGQVTFREQAGDAYAACAAAPERPQCANLRGVACNAIRAQASALEERLRGQLDAFRRAADCLEGSACAMDATEFRKTLAAAPPLPLFPKLEASEDGSRLPEQLLYAKSNFDWADSRLQQRLRADKIDAALNEAYVSAGLTLATFGVGELALLARGISVAATSSASTARAALSVARVLETGTVVADAGFAAAGIRSAVAECTATFADTSPLRRLPFDALKGPSCEAEYAGPQLVRDHQSCIAKAVLWEIATGLGPIVPDIMRLTGGFVAVSRGRAALGNRVLNPAQTGALETLFGRRLFKMGEDELAEAVGTLRHAGFGDDDIRRLLVHLAPQVKPAGDRLLTGLKGDVVHHAPVRLLGAEHTAAITSAAGRQTAYFCSECSLPLREFLDALASNPTYLPSRERLVRLQEALQQLESRKLTREEFAKGMNAITRELDELSSSQDGIRRALLARRARDPMAADSILRPGGGRAYMEQLREGFQHNYDGANLAPAFLPKIEALMEQGRLAPHDFRRVSELLDEALYFSKVSQSRLVKQTDRDRLGRIAQRLREELRGATGNRLDEETISALVDRFREAQRQGETMAGTLVSSMLHADIDLPRTTPQHRHQVNHEPARNPWGKGSFTPSPSARLEADHIYPVTLIQRLDGFDQLDWSRRKEVLHNPENIHGLEPGLNKLKAGLDAAGFEKAVAQSSQYKHLNNGNGLSGDYVAWLSKAQECMKHLLSRQIRCLMTLPPGAANLDDCRIPPGYQAPAGC